MRITYDPRIDAFALHIEHAEVVNTVDQGNGIYIDLDPTGRVLGVEVLDASTHFDPESLALIRPPSHVLSLAEASKESGLSPSTLRVLLNNRRLKGAKRGRDWAVEISDLWTYLESRAPAGRPAFKYKARRNRVVVVTDPSGKAHRVIVRGASVASKQRVAKLNPKGIATAARKMFGARKGPKARKK